MDIWFWLFIGTYVIGILWTLIIAISFGYSLKEKNILAWLYLFIWPLYALYCALIFLKAIKE